jgi:phenylalanine-4-hydroxylase
MTRRDRTFLQDVPFNQNGYASIVQTSYPGAHDVAYRHRVEELVEQSMRAWPTIPRYDYTEQEDATWAAISETLLSLQDRYSCKAYLAGRELLALPADRLPQLSDVSAKMEEETGFMLAPVGGLLDKGEFLSMLRHKVMRCTPYLRHPDYPFFTPEPDIVHELRGHAPMFMHKPFVEMSMGIGEAALAAVEAGDTALLDLIGLFYWYTVEYGLIREDGEIKIFGAGNNGGIQDLLRSMDPTIEKHPLELDAIRQLSIDYDAPQEAFFVAESYDQVTEMANTLRRMAGELT